MEPKNQMEPTKSKQESEVLLAIDCSSGSSSTVTDKDQFVARQTRLSKIAKAKEMAKSLQASTPQSEATEIKPRLTDMIGKDSSQFLFAYDDKVSTESSSQSNESKKPVNEIESEEPVNEIESEEPVNEIESEEPVNEIESEEPLKEVKSEEELNKDEDENANESEPDQLAPLPPKATSDKVLERLSKAVRESKMESHNKEFNEAFEKALEIKNAAVTSKMTLAQAVRESKLEDNNKEFNDAFTKAVEKTKADVTSKETFQRLIHYDKREAEESDVRKAAQKRRLKVVKREMSKRRKKWEMDELDKLTREKEKLLMTNLRLKSKIQKIKYEKQKIFTKMEQLMMDAKISESDSSSYNTE